MPSNSMCALPILTLESTEIRTFVIKYRKVVYDFPETMNKVILRNIKQKKYKVGLESLDYMGDIFDLRELNFLYHNTETKQSHQVLLREFANLYNLINLTIENGGLEIFPLLILQLRNLKKINLSKVLITEIPRFGKNSRLNTILLDHNMIYSIPLFYNPHIKYISFKNNLIENLLCRNIINLLVS